MVTLKIEYALLQGNVERNVFIWIFYYVIDRKIYYFKVEEMRKNAKNNELVSLFKNVFKISQQQKDAQLSSMVCNAFNNLWKL